MPLLRIVTWLPGLALRKLLAPVTSMLDDLANATEEHLTEQEEKYYSDIGAKVAKDLNEAWTHSNGHPVYANEGREN